MSDFTILFFVSRSASPTAGGFCVISFATRSTISAGSSFHLFFGAPPGLPSCFGLSLSLGACFGFFCFKTSSRFFLFFRFGITVRPGLCLRCSILFVCLFLFLKICFSNCFDKGVFLKADLTSRCAFCSVSRSTARTIISFSSCPGSGSDPFFFFFW